MEANVKNRLNEVLQDLNTIGSVKGVKKVFTKVVKDLPEGCDEFYQGEGGERHEIYHIEDLDMHVKLKIETDSYNEHEFITGVQFVEPKKVEKVVYVNKFD